MTIDDIIDAVAIEYYTSRSAIFSKIKAHQVTDARHTIAYIAVNHLGMYLKDISKALQMSVSATSSGLKSINALIETENYYRLKIERIRKRLNID